MVVYPGWYGRVYNLLYASLPTYQGVHTSHYASLPTTPWVHHVHTLVYTVTLVPHSTGGVYRDEALGSEGKNPLGREALGALGS